MLFKSKAKKVLVMPEGQATPRVSPILGEHKQEKEGVHQVLRKHKLLAEKEGETKGEGYPTVRVLSKASVNQIQRGLSDTKVLCLQRIG